MQEQLERVYAAAPVPEDYMKYQLHVHSGLEVAAIDRWFSLRRSADACAGALGAPRLHGSMQCRLPCLLACHGGF